jgi:phospholipase D1/2
LAGDAILQDGWNCWRRGRAGRVAFLVDGGPYFRAFRAACRSAERSIRIAGWDVHSRTRLVPGQPDDGLPAELGPFLNALLHRRRKLHVHILIWDFAMVYAIEREVLPLLNREWTSHRRMHFRLDAAHPLGASHHQKVVVIDDKVAFCGGVDLTMRRWDEPEHRPLDPRRIDPDGKPYAPFHDIQAAVDGEAAALLGQLVRERWRRATGRAPRGVATRGDPWPQDLAADLADVEVAVARTEPAFAGRGEVQEVQRLWTDAIRAARRTIFIENQYLTSCAVADALLERLREPDGPEVVVVLPKCAHGWLEATVLGDAQARLIRRLRAADEHGRLRLYYPVLPGEAPEDERWVRIHSKVLVVDDRLLRVGSSNTSNRSMGVDSECDLAVEADDEAVGRGIAGFRDRLLAEHLGRAPAEVADAVAAHGSLIRAIDALARPEGRGFASVDALLPPDPLELHHDDMAEANPFDPERPIRPERFLDDFLPEAPPRHRLSREMLRSLAGIALVLLVAALWAFTPLAQAVTPDSLLSEVEEVRGGLWTPLWVLGGFLGASMLLVPVNLLIAVIAATFGAFSGLLYAYVGALLSATLGFYLGRALGRDLVRRLAGRRLNRISRRLARSGIPAVAVLRLLPIAPFTMVNLVAGAMHLRYRDFLLGTALGMSPGIVAMTVLGAGIERVLQRDWSGMAMFVLLLVGLAAAGWLLQRWIGYGAPAGEAAASGK